MASSTQGLPRASADVDFVADLMPHHIGPWVAALGPDFEVDGVLKVQSGRLDLEYMRRWAKNVGVADLLERALMP